MSDRPSDLEFKMQHLVIAVKDLITEWYDLGLQLGLPDYSLRLIGSNPDIEGRLRMMLSKWLDHDAEASWEKLANALNTMGKNSMADNIRSKYVRAATTLAAAAVSDDDKTCEEMKQNILQTIKCQFASLQLKVRSAMEARQVKVNDVHQFLVASFQGKCCIPEVPDLTKIFNIVTESELWCYDNYIPLKKLAETFLPDDDPARKLITEYRSQLSGFYTTTKIVEFIDLSKLEEETEDDTEQPAFVAENYKKHYRTLTVKLKLGRKVKLSDLTLNYVDTLWKALIDEFNLPPLTAIIKKIVGGSLIIEWLVPPQVSTVIAASYSKALRFYHQHNIVKVWLDDDRLYYEDWFVGSTLLYQTSFMGRTEEVKEMMEGGADANEPNNNRYGETALFGACRGGHAEIARLLLDYGADVDYSDSYGNTALMEASRHGQVEIAETLLDYRTNIDHQNHRGETALNLASYKGESEIIYLLLKAGAKTDIQEEDGWTALHRAATEGYVNIVQMLVAHGAAVDIRTKSGMTALSKASYWGKSETVSLLLKAGAKTDIQEESGRTALHRAASEGYVNIVQMLVAHGAAVDIRTKRGSTGLMLASREGYTDTVRVLLEAKADPNITDEDNETALHWAAEKGRVEVIKMLVTHGAAVDIRNKEGLTVLDIARAGVYQAMCEVLEQCTKQETSTELTQEQRESIYQRLLKMMERTFLKQQAKKKEDQQKELHRQREKRVGGEGQKISLWSRLKERRNRPGQIIGTAPAPEK